MILKNAHPIFAATLAAATMFAYALLVDLGSAWISALAAVAFGIFIGIGQHRRRTGRPDYPAWVLVALAIAMCVVVAVLAWALLAGGDPAVTKWIPIIALFIVPVWLIYTVWQRRGEQQT